MGLDAVLCSRGAESSHGMVRLRSVPAAPPEPSAHFLKDAYVQPEQRLRATRQDAPDEHTAAGAAGGRKDNDDSMDGGESGSVDPVR